MRRAAALIVVLAAVPVLAGYLGTLHPAGDSFAVFRPQGAVVLTFAAALALALRARAAGLAGLALAAFAGGPLIGASLAEGSAGALRVYQKNMLFRNDDLAGLEADVRAAAPDVLTLQEVSSANELLLAALSDVLPHQDTCPFSAVGGTAIATRLAPIPGRTVCAEGLAAMQVQGPEGPLWLVSIHLHWPWPHRQPAQVDALVPVLEGLDGPVVMAGDFNMVRWSVSLGRMMAASRVVPAGRVLNTYVGLARWAELPIDHVFSPGGGQVEPRETLGSDHRGLLAEVSL
ncbi:endonuclease/exonuclease/phosphatase family protein [Rhodobacter sp. Har01]|uniref:endonuclease/exonuclease/phosphatase family protein n=1 Tax=Rhodobacter sp. Har01 TaxID=2883999 RepID=UPI001D08691E|nr:endonuclease/exonuclease/phosphatase family protein [Rhodobacter sp. Har01]MCB6177433.1 endonuclease/exonuclease/phosphatase family protein [Rhodobacter sp. Har01]